LQYKYIYIYLYKQTNKNKMKNTELKIGNKVEYTKTSIYSTPKLKQSTIVAIYPKNIYPEGYVRLENGDVMLPQALNVISNELTTLDKVKRIESILNKCNEKARYKFKVRRTKEQYGSNRVYCLIINGRGLHIKFLDEYTKDAQNEFWRLNNYEGQIHTTSQHNIKMYFQA